MFKEQGFGFRVFGFRASGSRGWVPDGTVRFLDFGPELVSGFSGGVWARGASFVRISS